jgi:cyclopropane fatty-acyl-phospholipid synthase-like methyltransferase
MALWPRVPSTRLVARYYDSWHDRYVSGFGDTFQSQRTEDLSELFRHIAEAAELQPGQRILDAGCGVGGPAIWLAREVGVKVEAITNSQRQAEEAEQRVKTAGLEKAIEVTLGDFHYLEDIYGESTFHAALFLESFVHSRHPEVVLRSVSSVLRTGAVLYMKDLFRRARMPRGQERRRVRRVVRNVNRYFCLQVQSQKRVRRALEKAGFGLEWFREMPLTTNHDIGNAFVAANEIDIYEGAPVTFLDWLELKARKP